MTAEAAALGLPAAVAMGLAFGAGPCNIACLPYLGPVFAATGEVPGRAWRLVVPFSAGRLVGYTALGGLAGAAGEAVLTRVEGLPVRWALGAVTIALGLLLLRRLLGRDGSGLRCLPRTRPSGSSAGLSGGMFAMGLAMALNPCLPLGTLILGAAASGSPAAGLALGSGFGAGAVAVPALVFGVGVAQIGRQLHVHLARWRGGLIGGSAALLVALGAATAMGWVAP